MQVPRAAIFNGAAVLLAAFIGAWGGREAVSVELRVLQETSKANVDMIARNAEQLALLTLHVRELSVISTQNFDRVTKLEERMRAIEGWRVEIADLASRRGIEIPDLRRRIEVLEKTISARRPVAENSTVP
jgi:hypothetical protein